MDENKGLRAFMRNKIIEIKERDEEIKHLVNENKKLKEKIKELEAQLEYYKRA